MIDGFRHLHHLVADVLEDLVGRHSRLLDFADEDPGKDAVGIGIVGP